MNRKTTTLLFAAAFSPFAIFGVEDAMKTPRLRDVRLKGAPAVKMNDMFRERLTGDFAKLNVFGEARRAFEERNDDPLGHGGLWHGEFWGKQMLSAARVADYLGDESYLRFIGEECRRLMATEDPDGYIGSYRDKELISITDPEKTRKIHGWYPVWNIWNRKYAMWGMLMAYKVTGDREILASVERQMKQLMSMLKRRNLRLIDTGTYGMCGLPSMSILKPLVMLYAETGDKAYLDFATETVNDWDRKDGACPNLLVNAAKEPLYGWYPEPEKWAKTYEFLSCVDGLVEYYRVTGDKRCLDTAKAIRDNIRRTDLNVFGSIGFGDKLVGAPRYFNALSEVCDTIHWIRLNMDLFLVTGDKDYLDSIEVAYYNAYLAGVWRGGAWGAFFIRGHQRHSEQRQCGCAYNHCCVNNLPRTFMDIATVALTRDRAGTFHLNLYQDMSAVLDGVRFDVSGNYPVENRVKVKISDPSVRVSFRKPDWCPEMDVVKDKDGYTLTFDMNTRVIDRLGTRPDLDVRNAQKNWAYRRYPDHASNTDITMTYRTTPAAYVMHGPLLLAKSRLVGNSLAEVVAEPGINGKGYSARVVPLPNDGMTWGLWKLELTKEGAPSFSARVTDFQSAGDMECGRKGYLFSIWF